MKATGWLSLALTLGSMALISSPALARDTSHHLPIQDVINSADGQAKLDPNIRFIFSPTQAGNILTNHGSVVTNRKTNAFNKTDEEACRWVMLSALIALQDSAREKGANAVVNIESFYKQRPFVSNTEYECHAGALIAGVALRGDIATLP